MSTFEEFQNEVSSEKLVLAIIEASKRLMGWTLDSGTVYVIDFDGRMQLFKFNGTVVRRHIKGEGLPQVLRKRPRTKQVQNAIAVVSRRKVGQPLNMVVMCV